MSPFPHLGILPAAQRTLWPELAAVPNHFVLYGGTAVALHLGHRTSVDFDFFSNQPFDPIEFKTSLPLLKAGEILQSTANTLTLLVDRNGPVKLSFFGGMTFGRVAAPLASPDGILRVASHLDLLASKLKTLLSRAEARDYVDMAALLRAGQDLAHGLAACRALFGEDFPIASAVRGLSYYDDLGEKLARADRQTLMDAVRTLPHDLPEVPLASPGLAP